MKSLFVNLLLSVFIIVPSSCLGQLKPGILGYTSVAFTKDNSRVITGDGEGDISIWEVKTGKRIVTLHYPTGGKIHPIIVSPDNKYMYVSAYFDNCFYKIEIATGKVLDKYCAKTGTINSIRLNSKGNQALTANSFSDDLKLWDLNKKSIVKTYTGHKNGVGYADYSPDEKYIVSSTNSLCWKPCITTWIWDAQLGKCIDSLRSYQSGFVTRYSPDGKYIIVGGIDNKLEVFDAYTKDKLRELPASNACYIFDFVFTNSGSVICTSGRNIRMWNISTGELAKDLETGHSSCIRGLAFDQEEMLVSVGEDSKIFLWDTRTWKKISEFK